MKRILLALAGVVAVLIGLGLIMPAMAKWRAEGVIPFGVFALLLLGCLLAAGGVGAAVFALKKPRA